MTSASHSRGRSRARVERALGLCSTPPLPHGAHGLRYRRSSQRTRAPLLRRVCKSACGPLCSARGGRGEQNRARASSPPTRLRHVTLRTPHPLYAQQPAPAELVKQPTRPQASPGGRSSTRLTSAPCAMRPHFRGRCMHPGSHLRAPTVHPGKLTARKALGSFSSAPTSASGRAQRLSQRRTRASSLLRWRRSRARHTRCTGGHASRLRAPAAPQGKPTARLAPASSTQPSQAPRTGHCGNRRYGGVQRVLAVGSVTTHDIAMPCV